MGPSDSVLPVVFECDYEFADFHAAKRLDWKQYWKRRLFLWLMLALLAGSLVVVAVSESRWQPLLPAGIVLLLLLLSPLITRWQLRTVWRRTPAAEARVRFTFDEDGIRLKTHDTQATMAWSSVTHYLPGTAVILLYHGPGFFRYLPTRVLSDRQRSLLLEMLHRQVGRTRYEKPAAGFTPILPSPSSDPGEP